MMMRRSLSLLLLASSFAVGLPACKSGDPPLTVGSVKKLGGAPARVLKLAFSGDGKSVLALERRSAEAGAWSFEDRYAITKRATGGGEAADLVVTEEEIVDFVPFGDGALFVDRSRLPPSMPEEAGESSEKRAFRLMLEERWKVTRRATSLREIHPGKEAILLAGEGLRCFQVAGAKGGEWAAYSVASIKNLREPGDAIVHVLGAKGDTDDTVTRTGVVYDISPDGARVLVLRRFPSSSGPGEPPDIPARPVFDTTAVSMVDVKTNSPLSLPSSIVVGGTEIKTDSLAVNLTSDGLSFRSKSGDVYRSALDGSKAVRVAGPLPEGGGAPRATPRRRRTAARSAWWTGEGLSTSCATREEPWSCHGRRATRSIPRR